MFVAVYGSYTRESRFSLRVTQEINRSTKTSQSDTQRDQQDAIATPSTLSGLAITTKTLSGPRSDSWPRYHAGLHHAQTGKAQQCSVVFM